MTDHVPDAALRDLGAHLDVPPPPDESSLTAAVLARLDDPPRRRPSLALRLAAAAAALLLALGVAMAVSPEVRAAVLDFLRIGAVEVNEQPQPSPSSGVLLPGERAVTLDQAREEANFPLLVPSQLGDPDAVTVADGARVVTLHYEGVRVDQFEGGLDPMFVKFFPSEQAVPTRVHGWQGVWLPEPHPVRYLGRDGRTHEQPARLAGTTLIWEQGGLTYRVEGDLTQDRAVQIAESLRR